MMNLAELALAERIDREMQGLLETAPTLRPLKINAGYLYEALHGPENIVARARKQLAMQRVDFDTIIGTGLSGALVVPVLARALGKHFAIVRKEDSSHSPTPVEGVVGFRWIFVDDLICSGNTFVRVLRAVDKLLQQHYHVAEYIGTYAYEHDSWFPQGAFPHHEARAKRRVKSAE